MISSILYLLHYTVSIIFTFKLRFHHRHEKVMEWDGTDLRRDDRVRRSPEKVNGRRHQAEIVFGRRFGAVVLQISGRAIVEPGQSATCVDRANRIYPLSVPCLSQSTHLSTSLRCTEFYYQVSPTFIRFNWVGFVTHQIPKAIEHLCSHYEKKSLNKLSNKLMNLKKNYRVVFTITWKCAIDQFPIASLNHEIKLKWVLITTIF